MSNIPWAANCADASDASFINSGSANSADISSEMDGWIRDEPFPDYIEDNGKLVTDLPDKKIEYASINTNALPPEVGIHPVEETLHVGYPGLSINMQIQQNSCSLDQLAHEWLNLNGFLVDMSETRRVFSWMDMNYVRWRVNDLGGGIRGIVRFLGYEFIPGLFNGTVDPVLVEFCVDNLLGGIGISEASDKILESMDALIKDQGTLSTFLLCPTTSQYLSSSYVIHAASLLQRAFDPTPEAAETSNLIVLTKAARNHRHGISKMKQSKMKLQSKMASVSTSKKEPKRVHTSVPSRQKIQHTTIPMKVDNSNKILTLLLQKELKKSDVSPLGRMVLPKKEAEANLPVLSAKDGMIIEMEDFDTSNIWRLRYRFWPNNKTRMYVLENTREFVKLHGLEVGDYMMIFKDEKDKKVIKATKVVKAAPLATKRECEAANDNGNNDTLPTNADAKATDSNKIETKAEIDDIFSGLQIMEDLDIDHIEFR
ncbi:hypothetical protein SUGI_1160450 [Cryptomeria japonica]|uniref:uncharacterized protein LOC131041461 n=1 Tax=Cryptomeria japonica TaxID=3369 RepID=UPI0024146DDD|nr:uncharacterized protein LOC131041461 [Cryptomeria japonica]GLJ54157.1 hypothetical protein SUGI_1160450 [Cryptomeria japonica]